MLLCHDPSQGYATFWCNTCEEAVVVHHSCNSRLCPGCGRRLTEEWADRIKRRLVKCDHRHVVFTLPDELWPLMRSDRCLIKVAAAAILDTVKGVFKRTANNMEITPGIVAVMHTFGEDLKFNVHFHCLVTCGGLNNCGDWIDMSFFFYEGLRKVWQYNVLTALKQALPDTFENARLIDKLFKDHPDGFYVRAKDIVKCNKGLLQYIARYVRHPAIAQSRIKSFDGVTVTFECKPDENNVKRLVSMPVVDFLLALVQHIPPKGFQLVRHVGLYANRSRKKYASVISMFVEIKAFTQKTLFSRSPKCPKCRMPMELLEVTPPTDPPPRLVLPEYFGQRTL